MSAAHGRIPFSEAQRLKYGSALPARSTAANIQKPVTIAEMAQLTTLDRNNLCLQEDKPVASYTISKQ